MQEAWRACETVRYLLISVAVLSGCALPPGGSAAHWREPMAIGVQWVSDWRVLRVGARVPDGVRLRDLGYSVAYLGDVDGDGVGDLAVGAPRSCVEGRDEAGAVVLVSGGDGGCITVLTPASGIVEFGRDMWLAEHAKGNRAVQVLVVEARVTGMGGPNESGSTGRFGARQQPSSHLTMIDLADRAKIDEWAVGTQGHGVTAGGGMRHNAAVLRRVSVEIESRIGDWDSLDLPESPHGAGGGMQVRSGFRQHDSLGWANAGILVSTVGSPRMDLGVVGTVDLPGFAHAVLLRRTRRFVEIYCGDPLWGVGRASEDEHGRILKFRIVIPDCDV